MVHIINLVSHSDVTLFFAVENSIEAIKLLFPISEHIEQLICLIEKTVELSRIEIDDVDAIYELGEGWMAEETFILRKIIENKIIFKRKLI